MVVTFNSLHYYFVNIDFHIQSNLVGEYDIHDSLVGGTIILEVKRHDIVVVVVMIRHQGGFWGVKGIHLNLFIP